MGRKKTSTLPPAPAQESFSELLSSKLVVLGGEDWYLGKKLKSSKIPQVMVRWCGRTHA